MKWKETNFDYTKNCVFIDKADSAFRNMHQASQTILFPCSSLMPCMSGNYILPIGYFYILFYDMVGLSVKYNTLNKLDTDINSDNGGFFLTT